jgi:pimeloyl-ACP methyl ester carboxylesterase
MTYALIPGAGGSAWYWHRVAPLLPDAIAIDLPASDDSADLNTYADTVVAATSGVSDPLILIAQSMGAFTAPIVASRMPVAAIVLVNPMVPAAGESPGQWWAATGQRAARLAYFERIGLARTDFDMIEDFFHDVPADIREEALRLGEPRQSDTPFGQPWPLQRWPDVPTRVIQGADDRCFPLEFQRRVVRSRLGLEVEVMPGGHLMALSQPEELVKRIVAGIGNVDGH